MRSLLAAPKLDLPRLTHLLAPPHQNQRPLAPAYATTRSLSYFMDSLSPPPADPAATCRPYAQSSPLHISGALLFLQQELAPHFPETALDWLTWANALDRLRPDLWEEGGRVSLDAQDVNRLAQYLAGSPELPTLEPPVHGPRAAYLAKRLVNYAAEARDALVELEAGPKAYGPRVWELVLSLALGNAVADEVHQATDWNAEQDGELAGASVHTRVFALRQARGEFDFPSGPPPAGTVGKARPRR